MVYWPLQTQKILLQKFLEKENVPKTFSKENKISKSKEEELELEKLF